jgi:hypothetical protein
MSAWVASIETSDQGSWRRANAAVADARTPLPARLAPANGSPSRARTTPLIGSTRVRASSARRRVSSNSTISCDESLPSRLLPSHCSVRARTSPPPTRRRGAPTTRSRWARRCSPTANGCGAPPRTPTRASFATRRPCGRPGTRRNEDRTGASARPQARAGARSGDVGAGDVPRLRFDERDARPSGRPLTLTGRYRIALAGALRQTGA